MVEKRSQRSDVNRQYGPQISPTFAVVIDRIVTTSRDAIMPNEKVSAMMEKEEYLQSTA